MGEKTAMQSKVMLSIVCVCVGGAQNSISPRATKGLEPALYVPTVDALVLKKINIDKVSKVNKALVGRLMS